MSRFEDTIKLRKAYETNEKIYYKKENDSRHLKKIMLDPHFTIQQNTSQIYFIIKWENKIKILLKIH